MTKCRICETDLIEFLDFGKMPIANGFLLPEQFAGEFFFDLKTAFCPKCFMAQLVEQPRREMMFNENYAYFSSISAHMEQHFKRFAESVAQDLPADPFVVEIGSNDGIMLKNFAASGIRHLGVEPSANVAQAARERGVNTLNAFFDAKTARAIKAEHGPAHAILAANVMCHIPDLHSVVEGMRELLAPSGVVLFEDPYLPDILEKTSYDQIYDEHVFYFSVAAISSLFEAHGMEVVDVLPQETHGGSMRYVIGLKGGRPVAGAVAESVRKEEALGVREPAAYERFAEAVGRSRRDLMEALETLRKEKKRVVGYGATSKSTTVANYCGITPEHVAFISDTTPNKQGRYSPGAHIPVRPYAEFAADYPDVALLFAWNHGREIMAKEGRFRDGGGKWLVYVPQVELL